MSAKCERNLSEMRAKFAPIEIVAVPSLEVRGKLGIEIDDLEARGEGRHEPWLDGVQPH
jgi:hypothetical protein